MSTRHAANHCVLQMNVGDWVLIACCALLGAGAGARVAASKPAYLQADHAPLAWIALALAAALGGTLLVRRIAALGGAQRAQACWATACAAVPSMCAGAGCVVLATVGDPFTLVLAVGALWGGCLWFLLGRQHAGAAALWLVTGSVITTALAGTLYRLVLAEYSGGTDAILNGALAAAVGGAWVGAVAARSTPVDIAACVTQ